jgi:hypothetical protein
MDKINIYSSDFFYFIKFIENNFPYSHLIPTEHLFSYYVNDFEKCDNIEKFMELFNYGVLNVIEQYTKAHLSIRYDTERSYYICLNSDDSKRNRAALKLYKNAFDRDKYINEHRDKQNNELKNNKLKNNEFNLKDEKYIFHKIITDKYENKCLYIKIKKMYSTNEEQLECAKFILDNFDAKK